MKQNNNIQSIKIKDIKLARNSRMGISNDEIASLMQSIKEQGLLQPIGVTKSKTGGYEIVYGNRRFLAVSKLGQNEIMAVVHDNKKDAENDIQNLTENIQRRNVSIIEIGRYVEILNKELSFAEIAARLSISESYIKNCFNAYKGLPEKHRDHVEVKVNKPNDRTTTPGKIALKTVNSILRTKKSFGLNAKQIDHLLTEARTNDDFNEQNVERYAHAMVMGSKNPVKEVPNVRYVDVKFLITEHEEERLYKKYIKDGPFRSFNELFVQILTGNCVERIKIVPRK